MVGKDEMVVLHESPFRVKKLLRAILVSLGDVALSLSCDLSKLHELTLRGKVSEVLETFEANDKAEKGEYVLVLDLAGLERPVQIQQEDIGLEARMLHLIIQGHDMQGAMKEMIFRGDRKNAVYAASLRLKTFLKEDYTNSLKN